MIQVDLQNIRSFIPLPYEAALSPRLRIAHDLSLIHISEPTRPY